MSDHSINDQREFYTHDLQCTTDDLLDVNPATGLRGCSGCSGVFKPDGQTGVAVTSLAFDEGRLPENIQVGEE